MSFNKIRIFYLNYYFIHIKDKETTELEMPSYLKSKFISIFMWQVILVVNWLIWSQLRDKQLATLLRDFREQISQEWSVPYMWAEPMQKEALAFRLLASTPFLFLPSLHCFPHKRPASSGCQHGLEMSSSPKNPPGPQQQAGGDSQPRGLSNPGFSASPVWNSHWWTT